jgi:hypothetical protein
VCQLDDDTASEVAMMQGGVMPKHNYEAAESAYLLDDWNSEDEEVIITAKNQY